MYVRFLPTRNFLFSPPLYRSRQRAGTEKLRSSTRCWLAPTNAQHDGASVLIGWKYSPQFFFSSLSRDLDLGEGVRDVGVGIVVYLPVIAEISLVAAVRVPDCGRPMFFRSYRSSSQKAACSKRRLRFLRCLFCLVPFFHRSERPIYSILAAVTFLTPLLSSRPFRSSRNTRRDFERAIIMAP